MTKVSPGFSVGDRHSPMKVSKAAESDLAPTLANQLAFPDQPRGANYVKDEWRDRVKKATSLDDSDSLNSMRKESIMAIRLRRALLCV